MTQSTENKPDNLIGFAFLDFGDKQLNSLDLSPLGLLGLLSWLVADGVVDNFLVRIVR